MIRLRWYRWLNTRFFGCRSFVREDPPEDTTYVLIKYYMNKVATKLVAMGYVEEWPRTNRRMNNA